MHPLLKIPDFENLLSNPIIGKSWEGFVIENIIATLPQGVNRYFYRISAGAEINLVLEFELDEYWAIEIKSSLKQVVTKAFYNACADIKAKKNLLFILVRSNCL